MSPQDLPACVQWILLGLTLLAIVVTFWQARLTFRQARLTFRQARQARQNTNRLRRRQLVAQLRAVFDDVCTTQAPSIADYEEIYQDLLLNYDLGPSYLITDLEYIMRCLAKSSKKPSLPSGRNKRSKYCFPVVSKRELLLSRNPGLRIKLQLFADPDTRTTGLEQARMFLEHFEIGDFASYLVSRNRRLWNAPTFELSRVEPNDKDVILSFQLGNYYRYVNNNEPCSKELYFHRYITKSKILEEKGMLRLIPPRNLIRDAIRLEDVFDFTRRPTCMGISAFVIMHKGQDKYCTFIQKRDSNQVEYPGCFHVAPAGTFQPLCDFDEATIQRQFALPYTVLRELLEEIFGLEEADRYRGVDPFAIFELKVDVPGKKGGGFCPGRLLGVEEPLQDENDAYKIVPTSLAVDLMTAKPHVSAVLVIKNPELYRQARRAFKGNWEGNVKEYDIESPEFMSFLEKNFDVDGFPPVGAITVSEGMAYYWAHRKQLCARTRNP